MTSDPSPGRRPGLGRLWTDPRETEEHTPWLEPKRAAGPPPPPRSNGYGPPGPGDQGPDDDDEHERALRRRRLLLGILVGTLLAAVLFGAGVLGAALLGGDEPSQSSVLPVVPGAAPAAGGSVRAVYANAKDSVVPVRVSGPSGAGSGTGFVIDKGGVIVTNAHVVDEATRVQVRLADKGRYVDARVAGKDVSSDLAVLKVEASAAASLRPLPLADSDDVRVGDQTLAIGYPLGLNRSSSASAGIVSGLGRSIDARNKFSIDKIIQTDAAINPGNSGGPLLDSIGRVIGVTSAILTAGGGGSVGVGFAVPSNTVRQVVPRLEQGRKVERAYLGVQTQDSTTGTGALVAGVTPSAPASDAGVQIGDIILGVGGQPVSASNDVSLAIQSRKPGDRITIQVRRGSGVQTLTVTLGTRPETASTTSGLPTP